MVFKAIKLAKTHKKVGVDRLYKQGVSPGIFQYLEAGKKKIYQEKLRKSRQSFEKSQRNVSQKVNKYIKDEARLGI